MGAGRLDGGEAVGQHGAQDVHRLAVTAGRLGELATHPLERRRQQPGLERGAVPERAGLASEHRHVVPGVVHGLAAPEDSAVLTDDAAVLAQLDAVGVGPDLDRPAHGARRDRVFVVVESDEAGLGDGGGHRVEAVERSGIGHQARPLGLEHLPDRAVADLGVRLRLGPGDAAVEQPSVELVIALEAQARCEHSPPDDADLVLDLALLPAGARGTGDRLHQVVPAHLQEPAIVGTLFADEDGVHRRLQVIVDPARAGPLEEGEGPIVAVEHHLLALARIRPHERHPAVAEPYMGDLHRHGDAVDQHDLVAPVELVGLARREAQRHIGRRDSRRSRVPPAAGIAADGIVAAFVAQTAKRLEDPHQREPLAHRLGVVPGQQPVERILDRTDLRQRLNRTFVLERRRSRPQNLADYLPG